MNRQVIAVCGNIALGKTTLIRELGSYFPRSLVFPERPDKNPFLEYFATGVANYAFPSQLWFLLNGCERLARAQSSDQFSFVERLPSENSLFARTILNGHCYGVYQSIHEQLSLILFPVTKIIYLKGSLDTIMNNIYIRNNSIQDADIFRDLAKSLVNEYNLFYHDLVKAADHYVIDCDSIDFVTDVDTRNSLLEGIVQWAKESGSQKTQDG